MNARICLQRLSIRDCSCHFVQCVLPRHVMHLCNISCNLSSGIESVKSLVLTIIPRQLTHVAGLTSLLYEISRPRWTRRELRASNEASTRLTGGQFQGYHQYNL